MQVKAVSKYNRISARKARLVADMVRGENANHAFDILKFTPKKAARLIEKTLKSAVSNAENNHGMDKKDLLITTILIDEGPTLKRHRPRARGMASAIRKRTSHVTIVLEGRQKPIKKAAENKDSRAIDKKSDDKKTEKVKMEEDK